jgi:uncharacterized membrane-anchored protein
MFAHRADGHASTDERSFRFRSGRQANGAAVPQLTSRVPGLRRRGDDHRDPAGLREPLAAKVPEIGLLFWAIKLLTTGIGESTSDFLGQTNVMMAGVVGVVALVVALRLQLRAREYRAPIYWSAVLAVAVFGTMAADGVRDGAGVSYAVTTAVCAIGVTAVFLLWYRSEGTLSIHSITTARRERFYWAAVFATFALGTAAGDWTAMQLDLGFFGSALAFGALIAIPALGWWRAQLNPIVAFWAAYIITRPLGASCADWFSKPATATGLGLGDGLVSAMGLLAFVLLVTYVSVTKRDIQPHPHPDLQELPRVGLEPQSAEG